MRILAALPYAPSLIRVRPYNLLRALARHHEVTLLVAGPPPGAADLVALREISDEVYYTPASLMERMGNCVVAPLRGEPLQAGVGRSALAEARLRDLVASADFDVVHVEHLRAGPLLHALPPDVPRVYDAVDSISLLWERTREASHSRLRRLIAAVEHGPTRQYEARLLRHCDEVAVTSRDDAEALLELAPHASVTVVPNGVDLEYFQVSDVPRTPQTMVFSGKMSYHANVSAILHFAHAILPLVRQRIPDARLRIVGSSPPREVLALAAADPLIEVTGYLPDLRPAIGSATVAVCPVTVKVGIQNKILEAMALGVPVVASAEGAAGLEATPGRDLLVGQNPAEQARHVVALMTDPALHDRVSAAGRAYVEHTHRWEAAAATFEHLYQQAIARHCVRVPA